MSIVLVALDEHDNDLVRNEVDAVPDIGEMLFVAQAGQEHATAWRIVSRHWEINRGNRYAPTRMYCYLDVEKVETP